MEQIKRSIDDSLRRIKGKIELVKKPHVGITQWLETHIPTASSSLMSLAALNDKKSESSTTSGPSTCSNVDTKDVIHTVQMPAKPSRYMSINVELLEVFEHDDGMRMRAILDKGLDPNFIDSDGKPLIYRAVEEQKYNILESMLDFGYGCDINSTCQNEINRGWGAIHLACHLGDLRAVEILLGSHVDNNPGRDLCDINAIDIDKANPLHILVESSSWIPDFYSENQLDIHQHSAHDSAASAIVKKETDLKSDLDDVFRLETDLSSLSLLKEDTFSSSVTKPKSPRSQLSSESRDHARPKSRPRSVSSRSLSGHAHIMKLLISAGCDVNRMDTVNGTPLHICTSRGNYEGMRILIKNGADVGIVNNLCETPLHRAMLQLDPKAAKLLLKAEPPLTEAKRYELSRLALTVIEEVHSNPTSGGEHRVVELLRLLLKRRIYVNVSDDRGRTMLHLASLYGYPRVAKCALSKPATNVNAQDDEGFSALFLAAWNLRAHGNSLALMELLLTHNARPDLPDRFGVYPANAALESGQYTQVLALIAHTGGRTQQSPSSLSFYGSVSSVDKHIKSANTATNGKGVATNRDVCVSLSSDRWFCASVNRLSHNTCTLPFAENVIISLKNRQKKSPCFLETAALLGRFDIVRAAIAAGADLRSVDVESLWHWASREREGAQYAGSPGPGQRIRQLNSAISRPRSLQDIARIGVRLSLRTPLFASIDCLPLPQSMKEFLKMTEYYQSASV